MGRERSPIIELLDAVGRAEAKSLGTSVVDDWDAQLDLLQAKLDERVEFTPPPASEEL